MDWPPLGDTQARDWLAACAHLQRAHSELREVISRFEPALLGEITSRGLSAYVLMHGIVQHDLWHAGQIMLLRKGFV